jgi:hypothetical protein
MYHSVRSALSGLAAVALAMGLLAAPAAAPTRQAQPVQGPTIGLGPDLAADGSFRGTPGIAGRVDASAWALVSDLAAGEAPRFAPASGVSAGARVPAVATGAVTTGAVTPAVATPVGPWSALGPSTGTPAINSSVAALAVSGSDLYVGGWFTDVAGIPEADYVARWDGSQWFALGSNGSNDGAIGGNVYALAVSGSDVYAGGEFTNAGGVAEADYLAKWNGSTWSALGSDGAGIGALNRSVFALAVAGSDLYVGGIFDNAGGIPEGDNVAKWDGSNWSGLGSDGTCDGAIVGTVYALGVSGSNLYVAGGFAGAAEIDTADNVAMWDGSNWSALGSNGKGDGAVGYDVLTLAVVGTDVYVGGWSSKIGGVPGADHIAKWDGSKWSALGSNGAGLFNDAVRSISGAGSNLYVGGNFTNVAGIPAADTVVRWNGSSWSALGSNGSGNGAMTGFVYVFAVSGSTLYIAGSFQGAAGIPTADNIVAWDLSAPIPPARKPDGRIRLGTAGALVGDDVYNATAAGQAVTGSALRNHTVSFGISVQNDGAAPDRLKVRATGAATSRYTVKYFHGATNITAAVVAGTFKTPVLAPGAAYLITAKVTVRSTAAKGSSVTRKVTVTSTASAALKDVVKLVGRRK